MKPEAKVVTIKDVARLADVSKKTVSRVLNNEPYVADAKVQKIREAIRSLNYVPNAAARHLSRGQSLSIAIVYMRESHAGGWLTETLGGVEEVSMEHGYRMIFHPCDHVSTEERHNTIRFVQEERPAGLIFLPPYGGKTEVTEYLIDNNIPFSRIAPPEDVEGWLSVRSACREGAENLTEHLVSLGHRRIAFIRGFKTNWDSNERLAAFQHVLARHEIPFYPELLLKGDFLFESGLAQGTALLEMSPRPTAIIACNDQMAAGVLLAAYQLGVTVPDEVSVAGFDNITWARRLCPPLTTVGQPIAKMAKVATNLLLDKIRGAETTSSACVDVPTKLHIRESTGPVP
jgi:LacI family transcriptional regulator